MSSCFRVRYFVTCILCLALVIGTQEMIWSNLPFSLPTTTITTTSSSPKNQHDVQPDFPFSVENLFAWHPQGDEIHEETVDTTKTDVASSPTSKRTNKNPQKTEKVLASSSSVRSSSTQPNPQIVWLASFPNSGTSYTMTMVERATNLSTATNYGTEISTPAKSDSIPVHSQFPNGPFWEGLEGSKARGTTPRHLPKAYVLTKTHCGGRCLHCGPFEYVVNQTDFVRMCQRTSSYTTQEQPQGNSVTKRSGVRTMQYLELERVAKVIHLIRSPFTNAVARFHLDNRHLRGKYSNDASGFRKWCRALDKKYASAEPLVFSTDIVDLLRSVPCGAEFYKYASWHSFLRQSLPLFGRPESPAPVLTVYYEDYATKLNVTVDSILSFLQQDLKQPVRPFRELPDYADHFRDSERQAAKALVKKVASPTVWKLIRHYFVDL